MRYLPMFIRMAEELSRVPRFSSPLQALFHEPPVWSVAIPRSWQQIALWQEQEFSSPCKITKEGYQVTLDVKDFNELKVKVLDDTVLLIEGKSKQKDDGQCDYSSDHFFRRFMLPEGSIADKVTSTLSSDGVLTINVPCPLVSEVPIKERIIDIQSTESPSKSKGDCLKEEADKRKT